MVLTLVVLNALIVPAVADRLDVVVFVALTVPAVSEPVLMLVDVRFVIVPVAAVSTLAPRLPVKVPLVA
ncbi:hypothetical protein [Variovorax sp. 278MFTsu5.1]|uniref:hypothetical protein n=1 Tax=Variovorax sp. 278MFTsu5.1 TaxID=3158366 RepID=UPI003AAEB7ED